MGKITNKELEALQAKDHGRVIREDGGIVGRVRAGVKGVTVAFRFEFKLDGAKRDFALGSWPKLSLAELRGERDKVRVTVAEGLDPTKARKAEQIKEKNELEAVLAAEEARREQELTLDDLFNSWIEQGVNRVDGNQELKRAYAKNISPKIGKIPLRLLTEKDIRGMIKPEVVAGRVRKAQVMLLNVKQMLSWGEKRQPWRTLLVAGNPAVLISEDSITPPDHEDERERVLSKEEIAELAEIFKRTEEAYATAAPGTKYSISRPLKVESQLALWICLGTLCRIGELLMAKWEHVNFDEGTWFIPKANVKGRRKKKQDHLIYLSDFSKARFRALHALTGGGVWCFPTKGKDGRDQHVGVNTVAKQVGDRQVQFMDRKPLKGRAHDNSLVLAGGANGNWTPHDMRRTGATMMQANAVSLEVIDRCQNHVMAGSKVRRSYFHHDYAIEKRDAWVLLGGKLQVILEMP